MTASEQASLLCSLLTISVYRECSGNAILLFIICLMLIINVATVLQLDALLCRGEICLAKLNTLNTRTEILVRILIIH